MTPGQAPGSTAEQYGLGLSQLLALGQHFAAAERERAWQESAGAGRRLCCAHHKRAPPLLAWDITPPQEDALQRGSMGWEEAELHKCTLSTHRAHLLGNKPPHLQPRAAKHFAASPAGMYGEVGEAAAGHKGPWRSAPGLSAPTIIRGEGGELRQSWHSWVISTHLASSAELERGCHIL